MQGWASSENCFSRQEGFKGNHHGEFTSVMFENPKKLLAALKAGEVRECPLTTGGGLTKSNFKGSEKRHLIKSSPKQ